MGRPKRLITPIQRRPILRLAARGVSYRDIVAELGVSIPTVMAVLRPLGGVIRHEWFAEPSDARVSYEERLEVYFGIRAGESGRSIARRLGRAPSTICRELKANGGLSRYHPREAERRARPQACRPKLRKLDASPELFERVARDLRALWSPHQIAARLAAEFGDDGEMTVSHETIYKSIYVQGRGELRRELARCLRSAERSAVPRPAWRSGARWAARWS